MIGEAATPPNYGLGENVRLLKSPRDGGPIIDEPIHTELGWLYHVQFGVSDRRWILAKDLIPSTEYEMNGEGGFAVGDYQSLMRNLALIKLRQPLADHLYAANNSRIEFQVHQFKPAIKFLRNPDQRLLIADEVGLGKTIEAGIIYQELRSRWDLSRVLVVCPASLRYKWQEELQIRFDERFEILDSASMRQFLNDYKRLGGQTWLRGIVSLETIRRQQISLGLVEGRVQFDLVIIDEAHHCRNQATMSFKSAYALSDNTDAMVMLTATPLHLGNRDLFNLLHILSPGEFQDFELFEEQTQPNRFINRAGQYLAMNDQATALQELTKIETTSSAQRFLANPRYAKTRELIGGGQMTRDDLIEARLNLLELNTLAHVFTRSLKREVYPDAPVRRAHTIEVDLSPPERAFYNAVIKYVRHQYEKNTGKQASGWATIMRERQTASCIAAMVAFFWKQVGGHYVATREEELILLKEAEDLNETFNYDRWVEGGESREGLEELKEVLSTATQISRLDTKHSRFSEAMGRVFQDNREPKVLVFSFFVGTLNYLAARLAHEGYIVHKIDGSVPVARRQEIIAQFRESPKGQILLSSEVGSEGLDFQFCSTLFNYDLPWNPMRVEQRIGRLDRFGQKNKVINIYNMVITDSIEARIFLRLYERIGLFKESIGDLEVILGETIRDLSRQIFSQLLSTAEESRAADRAIESIIQQRKEMEAFETNRLQLMGQDSLFSQQVENVLASGRYVSERELKIVVETFIKTGFPASKIEMVEEIAGIYTLKAGSDLLEFLRSYKSHEGGGNGKEVDIWQRLSHEEKMLITFSNTTAYGNGTIEYLNIHHPITRAAVSYWESNRPIGLPISHLALNTHRKVVGDFYYFLYLLHTEAFTSNSEIVPVVVGAKSLNIAAPLNERFMGLLQNNKYEDVQNLGRVDVQQVAVAKRAADEFMARIRTKKATAGEDSLKSILAARAFALERAYATKKQKLEKMIAEVTEARIIRMHNGQLRTNQENYDLRRRALDDQSEPFVSYSLELVGILSLY